MIRKPYKHTWIIVYGLIQNANNNLRSYKLTSVYLTTLLMLWKWHLTGRKYQFEKYKHIDRKHCHEKVSHQLSEQSNSWQKYFSQIIRALVVCWFRYPCLTKNIQRQWPLQTDSAESWYTIGSEKHNINTKELTVLLRFFTDHSMLRTWYK